MTSPTHGVGSSDRRAVRRHRIPVAWVRVRHEQERREPSIVLPRVDHRLRRRGAGSDPLILERRVGHRVLRSVVLRRERREQGRPVGERDGLRDGLDDVLQNQVRGRCDGRFIGRLVSEPSVQKVRPVMLRRDRVDRVIDSPLNHPHVDLRCRWCSARCAWKPRPGNAGDRADRNEVPLSHCSGVCFSRRARVGRLRRASPRADQSESDECRQGCEHAEAAHPPGCVLSQHDCLSLCMDRCLDVTPQTSDLRSERRRLWQVSPATTSFREEAPRYAGLPPSFRYLSAQYAAEPSIVHSRSGSAR